MPKMNDGRLPNRVRWFVVTQWNMDCDYEELVKGDRVRFVAYGPEVCPTTGRDHHQLYMYLHKDTSYGNRSLNKLGNMFGDIHCRVAPMFGKISDNESYCAKENRGVLIKHGDEPAQGARGDIDEAKEMIMKGDLTADDICVENPGFFHQYGRTLDRLEAIALRQRYRTWMTTCDWYTGPTGVGKSHTIFEDFDPRTHYVKNLNDEWWDGYKGQPIVIFNEFRGQIPFKEMLDLIDKWPKTVKWRCRESVPFLATRILISSIKLPEDVYVNQSGEPWGQWTRRVKVHTLKKRKRPDGPITTEVKRAVIRAAKTIREERKKRDASL